jgi:ABC-2 type transport system ATP-binding protein
VGRIRRVPPSATATEGIHARGVSRRFGTVVALDHVDLDVAPGEVVAVMGPSGAGKSTLLRVLATLVAPDAGTAAVAGADLAREGAAVRRAIGLVLGEERSWYWRLSGRANLEFFAALHGCDRATARTRAAALLTGVGLGGGAADRRVGTYSSGMRARLALARGLVGEPRVLLLDEPTRSLDVGAADHVRALLRDHVAERSTAVLLVTHAAGEAAALADRVVVLGDGRIVAAHRAPLDADVLAASVREAPR